MDDAAVLQQPPGRALVLTHDAIAEGVHYLPDDPPADVAWKLVAVNLSDLAAKGALPLGCLLSYSLRDPDWDLAFADGLAAALDRFGCALLGGDTIAAPHPVLGLTAIGHADPGTVPDRRRAQAGDALFVTGTIGDAGLGLRFLQDGAAGDPAPIAAYRRPQPQLAAGQALAPLVRAMADVSDGLLIDAQRMAAASGIGVRVDLDAVPLSPAYRATAGDDRAARLAAASAGDDYQLLFAAGAASEGELRAALDPLSVALTRVGAFTAGEGLALHDQAGWIDRPAQLGWQHGAGR